MRFVKAGFLATWFCGTKIQEIQKQKTEVQRMERFILQPADRKEAEKAMALIDEAKEFLKSQGIDQWQTGYPDMETIIGDLAHGRGYFIGEGSSAAAYLCIDFAGEASYETLQGSWKSDLPYAVVHRMAISGAYRGMV